MGNARWIKFKKKLREKTRKTVFDVLMITVIISVIAILLGVRINDLNKRYRKNSQKIQAVQEQINEEQKRAELLLQRENYMKSREYIEDIAKEKLGLVYRNEILLKPAQ